MKGIDNLPRFLYYGIAKPLVLGWIASAWLARLVPKRRGRILFIGREGQFGDNVKYLFLHACQNPGDHEIAFWSESPALSDQLSRHGLPHVASDSWRGLWYLLTASRVVVDNIPWIRHQKYHLLLGAHVFQCWHGCPLKKIERDDDGKLGQDTPPLLRLYHWAQGRYPAYDTVLSPSPFFTRLAFATAFKAARIVEDDYPRNAPLHGRRLPGEEIGTDAVLITRVRSLKEDGGKIILYMPTFRAYGVQSALDEVMNFPALERLAEKHAAWIVLKLHPLAKKALGSLPERIIEYHSERDIYPLLPHVDILITDYSSIYFDFLHLDRPILFYPYDLQRYLRDDRRMYVNYEDMAPGPICRDFQSLEQELAMALAGHDLYEAERERIRNFAFASHDGAALERLWSAVCE